MPDPVISIGATSTITWNFDSPVGYTTFTGGPPDVGNGYLSIAENTPAAVMTGTETDYRATAWDVNEHDADSVDCVHSVGGELIDGDPAWDITAADTASYKMRGNSPSTALNQTDANIALVAEAAAQLNVYKFWIYDNKPTGDDRRMFVGTWENSTTPEGGILVDTRHGSYFANYMYVCGNTAWPATLAAGGTTWTDTESIKARATGWHFVLLAGQEDATTGMKDRVVIFDTTKVVDLGTAAASVLVLSKGRFGSIGHGAVFATYPAYFDSYYHWQGQRYPTSLNMELPHAQPTSIRSVTGYTATTETTGIDRGGSVDFVYWLSTDGGSTWGYMKPITQITNETGFNADGNDVLKIWALLRTPQADTGYLPGLLAPRLTTLELEFETRWTELGATSATWTEAS